MRRRAIGVAGLAMALPCTRALAASAGAGLDPASLAGAWQGRGRWLDQAFHALVGPVEFELVVHPDLSCEGRAGDAVLARSPPGPGRRPVALHFTLPRPIAPRAPAHRLHLLLLLNGVEDGELDVDFHLKTHRGFDLGMQVGNLRAHRRS